MLAIDHVIQTTGIGIPELSLETLPRLIGKFVKKRLRPGIAKFMSKIPEDSQRVVPQGLDLHGLSRSGSHHPMAHLGVHPCQLDTRLAAGQKSVGVHVDPIASSTQMPIDDFLQLRIQALADESMLACI